MKRVSLFIFILYVTVGCCLAGISPEKSWRYQPSQWNSNPPDVSLNQIMEGKDVSWTTKPGDSWLAIRLPATVIPIALMWTYGGIPSKSSTKVSLEMSGDSKTGENGHWVEIENQTPKHFVEKFIISTSTTECWYRVRFDTQTSLRVTDIGLYRLDGKEPKDYWLILGASLEVQSIRNSIFKKMVQERYPDYDPVVFNLAVNGWRTEQLRKNLPDFLKEHPYATYCAIHIGGNNVSSSRPYPGGAKTLEEDLTAILEMIKESGKIPILCRLSYRAYKGKKQVPPEENGSGPYVEKIFDPLIKKYCPLFFVSKTGKGLVNPYDWYKKHQNELAPDGVHLNRKGEESWNRLWVEQAGSVIYSKPAKRH